jgi:uncharacterized membrane protein YfcA
MVIVDEFLVLIFGLLAGFLIPIANISGLLSLSGLLLIGLPIHASLATNRMGGIGLWPPVIYQYQKAGLIEWKYVVPLSVISALGGVIGANILISIPEDILKVIVSFIMLILIIVMVTNKKMGIEETVASNTKDKFIGYIGCFLSCIYGGFFGSGQSLFVDFFLMRFFGFTVLQCKATMAIPIYFMIISSVAVFIYQDIANIVFGIILAFGMSVGGWYGSKYAIRIGNVWLRKVFIACIVVMICVLLSDVAIKFITL